jgi:hypothetical protein
MEIRNRALQAKEMQTSITYQRQQNTNVNKMPKLTKYQRRQIININKMPTSTKCQRQQNANVNKMSFIISQGPEPPILITSALSVIIESFLFLFLIF